MVHLHRRHGFGETLYLNRTGPPRWLVGGKVKPPSWVEEGDVRTDDLDGDENNILGNYRRSCWNSTCSKVVRKHARTSPSRCSPSTRVAARSILPRHSLSCSSTLKQRKATAFRQMDHLHNLYIFHVANYCSNMLHAPCRSRHIVWILLHVTVKLYTRSRDRQPRVQRHAAAVHT